MFDIIAHVKTIFYVFKMDKLNNWTELTTLCVGARVSERERERYTRYIAITIFLLLFLLLLFGVKPCFELDKVGAQVCIFFPLFFFWKAQKSQVFFKFLKNCARLTIHFFRVKKKKCRSMRVWIFNLFIFWFYWKHAKLFVNLSVRSFFSPNID